MLPIPGFHVYLQASRFSRECSREVGVVAPSIPAPTPVAIDLNATSVAGASSSRGVRKRPREMPANMLPGDRNLFDRMSVASDDEMANRFIIENIIFEGGAAAAASASGDTAAACDPEKTQSQDRRSLFTPMTYD